MAKKKLSLYSDNISNYLAYETQEEMERNMYRAAGRRHYTESLENQFIKPAGEPFYECQKLDSVAAYNRAGLNAHSGADNQKEDMQYARKVGVGKKRK